MKYTLKREDFIKAFEFSVKYHLDPKKTSSTRTAGSARGLGGVLDSFMHGKLVEIGVAKILNSLKPSKTFELDFSIKPTNDAKNDPDIVKITESNHSREPNVYTEIKHITKSDRYLGLTTEQFTTAKKMSRNKEVYIIGAYLENSGKEAKNKKDDVLGVFLKTETSNSLLGDFSEIGEMSVVIDYVISGKELEKNGLEFKQGSLFYETEIFVEAGPMAVKAIDAKILKKISEIKNGELKPYMQIEQNALPSFIRPIKIMGYIEVYEKKNDKSSMQFIRCISDTLIENDFLGKFYLKAGNTYLFDMCTIGRNPSLDRNNIWIAKRSVGYLQEKGRLESTEKNLKSLADQI
ncbi:MAG: hypothetical protein AAB656_03095 [Patescibacteria group bacterium]